MNIEQLITAEDIISCFSGAISADFAGYERNGIEEIEFEIGFQAAYITSLISQEALNGLSRVNNEILIVRDGIITTSGVPILETLRIRHMPTQSCGCICAGSLIEAEAVSGSNNEFELDLDSSCYSEPLRVIASYDLDDDEMDWSSSILKLLLRSLVAHSLGVRLFPSGSELWQGVLYHKEQSEKLLTMVQSWKPEYLQKAVFYKPLPVLKVTRA